MEAYKKSLSTWIRWMILGIAISLVVTAALFMYSFSAMDQSRIGDFVHGVQTGIFAGIFFGFVTGILKIKMAQKDEVSLRKSYILANDERRQFIFKKMGFVSFYVENFFLMLAIIISGFFSEIVCVTLLAVLIVLLTFKILLYFYFDRTC